MRKTRQSKLRKFLVILDPDHERMLEDLVRRWRNEPDVRWGAGVSQAAVVRRAIRHAWHSSKEADDARRMEL